MPFKLIIAGLLVGFLIGLTGMGGGALMTPFLLIVLKMEPVVAVGTDLTFAAITKIIGGIQHRREQNVSLPAVGWMSLGSLPASILGARIVIDLDNRDIIQDTLPIILGAVLLIASLIIFARAANILEPKENPEAKWPSPLQFVAIGLVGGFLVGMTSIGGGTVIMALLILFFTIPLNCLVGLDVVHGALLAGVSAITYGLAGQVDLSTALWLLAGSMPGVWFGAHAVSRVNRRLVRTILALFILAASIHLLTVH